MYINFGGVAALCRLRPELYAISKNHCIVRGNGDGEKRALKTPPYSRDEASPKIDKKQTPIHSLEKLPDVIREGQPA